MTYTYRTGDLDRGARAQPPTKGLRLKLRTALRAAGVTGKFRTDEIRGKPTTLVVIGDVSDTSLQDFEGHQVIYRK